MSYYRFMEKWVIAIVQLDLPPWTKVSLSIRCVSTDFLSFITISSDGDDDGDDDDDDADDSPTHSLSRILLTSRAHQPFDWQLRQRRIWLDGAIRLSRARVTEIQSAVDERCGIWALALLRLCSHNVLNCRHQSNSLFLRSAMRKTACFIAKLFCGENLWWLLACGVNRQLHDTVINDNQLYCCFYKRLLAINSID